VTPEEIWAALRLATPARLGLGRSGAALPTRALLDFGIAHAQARDAVHSELDWQRLDAELTATTKLCTCRVESAANDRATYLRRPDLGRQLAPSSSELLANLNPKGDADIVLVLGDGLSAAALQNHAVAMVAEIEALLPTRLFRYAVMARHARVALGDQIGSLLQARYVVVAIGERPGLSSPDSLGLYLTRAPRPGRSDAERNCLSNIHSQGMPYATAAKKLAALIEGAERIGATGTRLKDETDAQGMPALGRQPAPQGLPKR
jgi:ethanolamine ammonia-lyase small subunit